MNVEHQTNLLSLELDAAEASLQQSSFEIAASSAYSLLKKLLVFPGGEKYEAAAACVLIQAYCNQERYATLSNLSDKSKNQSCYLLSCVASLSSSSSLCILHEIDF